MASDQDEPLYEPPEDAELARLSYFVQVRMGAADGVASHGQLPGRVLSHYTDAGGLLGIVSKHELWATDVLFMNDTTELSWATEYVHSNVLGWVEAAIEADTRLQSLSAGLRSKLGRVIHESFLAEYERTVSGSAPIYAVCFCEEGDLLSQWRGYGNFGGGYSLEVLHRQLQLSCNANPSLSLLRVEYEKAAVLDQAERTVTGAVAQLYDGLMMEHLPHDTALEMTGSAIADAAWDLAVRVKHPAFKEEREWRIVYREQEWAESPPLKREFRATSKGLAPYVRLPTNLPPVDADSEDAELGLYKGDPGLFGLPLTRVTVGPTADPDISIRSVNHLLSDHGYSGIPVARSDIPLRG